MYNETCKKTKGRTSKSVERTIWNRKKNNSQRGSRKKWKKKNIKGEEIEDRSNGGNDS